MSGLCAGRVAIVTGGGRGLGREHALELAAQGAQVVVNDLGVELDGTKAASDGAHDVVEEIRARGGSAVADGNDVSDWLGAEHLVQHAIDEFGALDILVNNAGILRDKMLFNLSAEEWDAVVSVHLRGTFATTRWAARHWRDRAKAGLDNDARIINTVSVAGLFGHVGQANYAASKAGVAAMTLVAAEELARYGVTVNAISPGAKTRMTTGDTPANAPGSGSETDDFQVRDPANVSPLVAWLASPESAAVTGRVFGVRGGVVSVIEGWHVGPQRDAGRRWRADELGAVVPGLVAAAAPNADIWGVIPARQPGSAGSDA